MGKTEYRREAIGMYWRGMAGIIQGTGKNEGARGTDPK